MPAFDVDRAGERPGAALYRPAFYWRHCAGQRRGIDLWSDGGASPTSHRYCSPGAPSRPPTAAPPGAFPPSRCWPPKSIPKQRRNPAKTPLITIRWSGPRRLVSARTWGGGPPRRRSPPARESLGLAAVASPLPSSRSSIRRRVASVTVATSASACSFVALPGGYGGRPGGSMSAPRWPGLPARFRPLSAASRHVTPPAVVAQPPVVRRAVA